MKNINYNSYISDEEKQLYMEIPFGNRSLVCDCVFVWIYAKNCNSYKNYHDVNNSKILTVLRWDGMFGTVGGKVDPTDKTLLDALQRESVEEIGYQLDINKVHPLVSFKDIKTGTNIHSYVYEVSENEINDIQVNAHKGEFFTEEMAGVNLVHASLYNKDKGITKILEQNFTATAKLELIHLISKYDIIKDYRDV